MNWPERAMQIYQVLLGLAYNRQTITYASLAKLIGMGAGTLAQPLGYIMRYCKANKLPPLTALVVQTKSGKPGEGLTTVKQSQLDKDREDVYNHNWFISEPVQISDLEKHPFK